MLDVFSNDDCISHFYTNDLMVLIDIIARYKGSDMGAFSPGFLVHTKYPKKVDKRAPGQYQMGVRRYFFELLTLLIFKKFNNFNYMKLS